MPRFLECDSSSALAQHVARVHGRMGFRRRVTTKGDFHERPQTVRSVESSVCRVKGWTVRARRA
jgi:hypothetical protein